MRENKGHCTGGVGCLVQALMQIPSSRGKENPRAGVIPIEIEIGIAIEIDIPWNRQPLRRHAGSLPMRCQRWSDFRMNHDFDTDFDSDRDEIPKTRPGIATHGRARAQVGGVPSLLTGEGQGGGGEKAT